MKQVHRVAPIISKLKKLLLVILIWIPLAVIAALPDEPQHHSINWVPSPELEPSEVIRIQVEALRNNTLVNEGIELTYRFASPGNKRYTGPLHRFTEMVRSAPYERLLNHLKAQFGPLSISGEEAYQLVTITDKEGDIGSYAWVLSRQNEGKFEGCWMTDAVLPAERSMQYGIVQTLTPLEIAIASYRTLPETQLKKLGFPNWN